MASDVMVLRQADKAIHLRAKKMGLRDVISESGFPEEPFDRAVIVAPGTKIPWDLLEYGFHFLERWDAAVPLWKYGGVAEKSGTKEERAATEALSLDLRLLLCAPDLLFVRGDGDGLKLVQTWQAEMERFPDADPRLAFLRAHCIVKARLCVLPRGWLREDRKAVREPRKTVRSGRRPRSGNAMIRVELAPGRFVRCVPGDAEKVKKMYENKLHRRRH